MELLQSWTQAQQYFFCGIAIGFVAAWAFNKYKDVRLPSYLGFFAGRRFVPIVGSFYALVVGLVAGFVWPPIGSVLDKFGVWIVGAGFIGLEAAATAKQLGADVTVLEGAPAPLIRGLGAGMGAAVAGIHERNGVASLFMMFAPLEGWRCVKVTDRHAAVDYAHVLKDLSDTHFPGAAKIVLVQDNLSTHSPASLYAAFPAAEARRLAERFEWHYTPKHGSWLDMAESELGVLATQCLDRRIPDKETLTREIAAWVKNRNVHHAKADWQFTTADARVKLKKLYPQFE